MNFACWKIEKFVLEKNHSSGILCIILVDEIAEKIILMHLWCFKNLGFFAENSLKVHLVSWLKSSCIGWKLLFSQLVFYYKRFYILYFELDWLLIRNLLKNVSMYREFTSTFLTIILLYRSHFIRFKVTVYGRSWCIQWNQVHTTMMKSGWREI